jgi:hypothetical protein
MASTYVNDLRLNEMATGDASGSWGTVTNTNLELIGEAFSYGTETIGDADSTLTIADGAADAARSFYLKITSSVDLTTTRIVTLAPNTVSKVWMIENATTGSQVITIKQGSGATINVPNGQVKMISTDGAGSGGAVLDLLVDVDLTGTTTLVNLDVSGAVDIAGDLTLSAGGDGALRFTAASSVKVLDNNAAALVFEEADNAYMTFVTTDGSEAVKFDKALDINAATQIDATVTVGVDDTGYDVKFFGATAGAYMLWDESADDLILGGAAGLSVNSAATVGGTLGVTGVVTANAGVVVDNFTLDGTTLALSSGDMTLDVAGDIILDADGGDVRFKDGGTEFGTIYNTSSNLGIASIVQNKDIIFQGFDDSSLITALTLDMSEAGNARFANDVKLISDSAVITIGVDSDLKITHNGTNGDFESTGDLSFDVVNNIVLDAGGGNVFFNDDDTTFGSATNSSGNLILKSGTTTAATFSGANVTFAGDVTAGNSVGVAGSGGMPVLQQAAGSQGFPSYSFYDDGNTGMYRISSDFLGFSTGGALRLAIDSDGLKFNGDTAAANALDDYEEGTYTATITPSGSGSIGLSSGFGTYTKIGNLVNVNASCSTNAISSPVGYVKVNLPFTCNATNQNGRGAASLYLDGMAAGANISEFIGLTIENTTECRIYLGDAVTSQSDSAQQFDSDAYLLMSVTYRTA